MTDLPTKPPICALALALLVTISSVRADEPRELHGRVVDRAGLPVAGAAVGNFWRANGLGYDRDGKPYDLSKPENVRLIWGNLGAMEPSGPPQSIRTGSDGRFTIKDPNPFFAVMAMDASRRYGGIALLPKSDQAEPLEIRVVPLVTVRGSFEGPAPVSSRVGLMFSFICPRIPAVRSTAPSS